MRAHEADDVDPELDALMAAEPARAGSNRSRANMQSVRARSTTAAAPSDDDSVGSDIVLSALVASEGGPAAVAAPSRSTAGGSSSKREVSQPPVTAVVPRAVGSDLPGPSEEELLLEALEALTSAPAPFVSSAKRRERLAAEAPGALPAPAPPPPPSQPQREEARQTTRAPPQRALDGRATASEAAARTGGLVVSLDEEEAVLDAILGSLECQQSTVSGDLADEETDRLGASEDAAVARVLAQAAAIASSSCIADGAAPARRGERLLAFHEHAALQRTLLWSRPVLGSTTCVALRPRTLCPEEDKPGADKGAGASHDASAPAALGGVARLSADTTPSPARSSRTATLYVALGTSLGAVMLFDERWAALGVCGSVEPTVVAQRGGVLSLSIAAGATAPADMTIASSHERGCYILWSVETLAPVRVLEGDFPAPVQHTQHLFCDAYRTLTLDASGCLRLLTYTRVLGAIIFRSSTLAQGHAGRAATGAVSSLTAIADFDAIPHPSLLYLQNEGDAVRARDRGEVPVLLCTRDPSTATEASPSPFVQAGYHLVATVCSDTVLLHVLETGLVSGARVVARHTHPPLSSLSSELVRFAVLEQGEVPRVLVCVSWNTEVELLRVVFDLKGGTPVGLERVSVTAMVAPVQAMASMAGGSLVLVDQANTVLLLDTAVGVMVERHTMPSLQLIAYTHRLSGTRYRGALATDRRAALVLCRDRIFTCALLSWDARLRALLTRRCYTDAIALVQDLAEEVGLCTVGLQADAATRRRALRRYIEAICLAYVRDTVTSTEAGPPRAYALDTALTQIVTLCSRVGEVEPVLFGRVMPCLRECGESGAGFLALERGIRQGLILAMPALYAEALLAYLTNPSAAPAGEVQEERSGDAQTVALSGRRRRAEDALMRVETDVDALERLADANGLTRLRVTARSLRQGRYGEALRLALESVPDAGGTLMENVTIALDYVERTMRGASLIPDVALPPSARSDAKRQVWSCMMGEPRIFYRLLTCPRRLLDIVLFAIGDGDSAFPLWSDRHLTLSLPHNVARVFCLLIGEPTETPASVLFTVAGAAKAFEPWLVAQRSEVSVRSGGPLGDGCGARLPPYADSVHYFIDGLVELLGTPQGSLLARSLTAPEQWQALCEVMVQHYTYMFDTSETPIARRNAQVQLNKFLRGVLLFGGPAGQAVRLDRYTAGFREKGMARCLAAAHCREAAYTDAIDCYTDWANNQAEPNLAGGVFCLLRAEVARLRQTTPSDEGPLADEEDAGRPVPRSGQLGRDSRGGRGSDSNARALQALHAAVMERVDALVQVDATALAQFVFDVLPSDSDGVMRVLKSSSKTFLRYLDELLAKGDVSVANDVNLQNNYIELLCAHEPARVFGYLRDRHSSITYDVQVALRAVRKNRIIDATTLLLARTFMMDEAMHVLVRGLRDALASARASVLAASLVPTGAAGEGGAGVAGTHNGHPRASAAGPEGGPAWAAVEHLLSVGTDLLCEHHSPTQSSTTGHWFLLLDTVDVPRRVMTGWLAELQALPQRLAGDEGESSSSSSGLGGERAAELSVFWQQRANELSVTVPPTASTADAATASVWHAPPLPAIPPAAAGEAGRGVMACLAFASAVSARYTAYTTQILRTMVRVVDLSAVVSKLVRDGEGETFGPLQPILVDVMSSIRFDLEVRRLCHACIEEDLLELGGSLYHHLNSGVVPMSDACYLCDGLLAAASPLPEPNAVISIFACGHGFHEACRASAAATENHDGCPQCHAERTGAAGGGRRRARVSDTASFDTAAPPTSAAGGSRDAGAAAERRVVLARRLRQTRARLGQHEPRQGLPTSLVALSASAAGATDPAAALRKLWQRHGAGGLLGTREPVARLVRAPAPRLPVSLADPGAQEGPLDLTGEAAIVARLTDAEIIELFGDG